MKATHGSHLALCLFILLLLAGCKPTVDDLSVETSVNQPVAITLTGKDSANHPLTFRVVELPSQGSLTGEPPNLVYTPAENFVGIEQFSYVANDGKTDSNPATVTITVSSGNSAPVPVVDHSLQVFQPGQPISIDASRSFDIERDPLQFVWSLESAPEGHGLDLSAQQTSQLQLTPNLPGTYVLHLVVSDGQASSAPLRVVLLSDLYDFQALPFLVSDAEYDVAHDRIVFVSNDPAALHVYDITTGSHTTLPLANQASAIAVAADGKSAVVGHNGAVTHVDLVNLAVLNAFSVDVDVFDIILNTGYAHIMPRVHNWNGLRTIDLATGELATGAGYSVYGSAILKRHPNGQHAYAADRGVSPSDIEKFDVSGNTAVGLYDSPYHGDFAMCGNLWISQDGKRIFTACSNVFSSSDTRELDMRYTGKLADIGGVKWVSDSAVVNDVYAIQSNAYYGPAQDTAIHVLDKTFLTQKASYQLPTVYASQTPYTTHGHYVFPTQQGSHIAVVSVDPDAGWLRNWGVARLKADANPGIPPVARIAGEASVRVGTKVTFDGQHSESPNQTPLRYYWQLVAAPAGSNLQLATPTSSTIELTPLQAGEYTLMLVVFDGTTYSAPHQVTLQVVDSSASYSIPLSYDVVDAEYSEALDKLVMVTSSPNQLVIFDPVSLRQARIALTMPPTAVAVDLAGVNIVIGHNGWITHVDVATESVLAVHSVSTDVFDLVVTHGRAHVMPRQDQWESIRTVDLATGIENPQTGYSVRAGTVMKLHASGNYAYGADRGLSPADIEKYDVSGSPAVRMYDSPYHGDYAMCGNLWLSEDGLRIYTGCGNIFRASSDRNLDMTYNGKLTNVSGIVGVSNSMESNEVLVLHSSNQVSRFVYDTTTLQETFALPALTLSGESVATAGKFIFHNAAGDRFVAVMQATGSGLANTFAIHVQ